jgi:hypothetical protein
VTVVLEVGKPYIGGRKAIAPRSEYNFRAGQHELLLCFTDLTEPEIRAVREGEPEFALVVLDSVIFFLYRFGGFIDWSAAPYSWHLVPAKERELPKQLQRPETRALLLIVLVDADSNIVRALRAVMLPAKFTAALHAALRAQAGRAWTAEAYNAQVSKVYNRWPTTEQMLRRAVARCRGGA